MNSGGYTSVVFCEVCSQAAEVMSGGHITVGSTLRDNYTAYKHTDI